ncbi:hypothetical protein [Candidatus Nitrosacidococcus tergens]|uniref:Amino acid permease n=1 Tax=Candidatus Nitrosacidococcus tergens TaxID=553981 RepID=A0A7G1Q7I6_9GAMM|nr:hypothetical protein [Candidatus Nitrosacidococcus tergens]CAB1274536.1 membrane protein of unknown function [Candidatus Nitrosacidococcus tergens]
MLFSTLILASIVVSLLWFSILQKLESPKIGYFIVILVGITFLYRSPVHSIYIGIEIMGLGCLVVWIKYLK